MKDLTLSVALGWMVLGFTFRWIAPGSALKEKDTEIARWAERHDRLALIAEAALRKASGA